MTIEEINQAMSLGKQVKWLSSNYVIVKDSSGLLYKKNLRSGFREQLTSNDLDDCFI